MTLAEVRAAIEGLQRLSPYGRGMIRHEFGAFVYRADVLDILERLEEREPDGPTGPSESGPVRGSLVTSGTEPD
jgi:hypothetical protein